MDAAKSLDAAHALFYGTYPMPESSEEMKIVGHATCICSRRATKWCNKCQVTAYCSPECQKTDWKEGLHKAVCKPNPAKKDKVKEMYGALKFHHDGVSSLRERILALAMGTHERLGHNSVLSSTHPDVVKLLFSSLLVEAYDQLNQPFSAVHVPALGAGNLGSASFRRRAQDSLQGLTRFDALKHSQHDAQCQQFRWSCRGGETVAGYSGLEAGTIYAAAFDDMFQSSQRTPNPVAACLFNTGASGSFVFFKLKQGDLAMPPSQEPVSCAEIFNLCMARLASLVIGGAVTDRMWRFQMQKSAGWNQEHAWNLKQPPSFRLVDDLANDSEAAAGARGAGGGAGREKEGGKDGRREAAQGKGGAACLAVGSWVVLSGLSKAVELNGQVGTVRSGENGEGRVSVEIEERDGGEQRGGRQRGASRAAQTTRSVNVRVGNLAVVPESEMTSVVRMACDGELRLGQALKVEQIRVPRAHHILSSEASSPGKDARPAEPCAILSLAGFAVHLAPCAARVRLRDQADYDNQWATWLMIEPVSGFAPPRWQRFVGPVLAFRPSGDPLSQHDVVICNEFSSRLLDKYDMSDPTAVVPARDITASQLARAAKFYVMNQPRLSRLDPTALQDQVHICL